jgi:hypothetical protein
MKKIIAAFLFVTCLLSINMAIASSSKNKLTKTYQGKIDSVEFTLKLPPNYMVESGNGFIDATQFSKETLINGVKFTKENGANQAMLTVETASIPDEAKCDVRYFQSFLGKAEIESTDDDVLFTSTISENGINNKYAKEKIWAIANSKPCVAVRYFYITEPEVVDGIISYEEKNLLKTFDAIRHSLIVK